MNTLIFLCGCGVGALLSSILFLVIVARVSKQSKAAIAQNKEQHQDVLEQFRERNDLLREQNRLIYHKD